MDSTLDEKIIRFWLAWLSFELFLLNGIQLFFIET